MRAGELILAHFVTAYQHLLAGRGVAAAPSWAKAISGVRGRGVRVVAS